jgi:hypothetical protein
MNHVIGHPRALQLLGFAHGYESDVIKTAITSYIADDRRL